MEARLASTSETARRLGFVHKDTDKPNTRAFLAWVRKQQGFPRPEGKHHLWWDVKAIHRYLDNKTQTQIESEQPKDYESIVRERLARYGNPENEIRR